MLCRALLMTMGGCMSGWQRKLASRMACRTSLQSPGAPVPALASCLHCDMSQKCQAMLSRHPICLFEGPRVQQFSDGFMHRTKCGPRSTLREIQPIKECLNDSWPVQATME